MSAIHFPLSPSILTYDYSQSPINWEERFVHLRPAWYQTQKTMRGVANLFSSIGTIGMATSASLTVVRVLILSNHFKWTPHLGVISLLFAGAGGYLASRCEYPNDPAYQRRASKDAWMAIQRHGLTVSQIKRRYGNLVEQGDLHDYVRAFPFHGDPFLFERRYGVDGFALLSDEEKKPYREVLRREILTPSKHKYLCEALELTLAVPLAPIGRYELFMDTCQGNPELAREWRPLVQQAAKKLPFSSLVGRYGRLFQVGLLTPEDVRDHVLSMMNGLKLNQEPCAEWLDCEELGLIPEYARKALSAAHQVAKGCSVTYRGTIAEIGANYQQNLNSLHPKEKETKMKPSREAFVEAERIYQSKKSILTAGRWKALEEAKIAYDEALAAVHQQYRNSLNL